MEVGERRLIQLEFVDDDIKKIRLIGDILKVAQDRKRKYYDPNHQVAKF